MYETNSTVESRKHYNTKQKVNNTKTNHIL